jgi:hypothetical protein
MRGFMHIAAAAALREHVAEQGALLERLFVEREPLLALMFA